MSTRQEMVDELMEKLHFTKVDTGMYGLGLDGLEKLRAMMANGTGITILNDCEHREELIDILRGLGMEEAQ